MESCDPRWDECCQDSSMKLAGRFCRILIRDQQIPSLGPGFFLPVSQNHSNTPPQQHSPGQHPQAQMMLLGGALDRVGWNGTLPPRCLSPDHNANLIRVKISDKFHQGGIQKIPGQESSKLSGTIKNKEVPAKRNLRRHDDYMLCGSQDGVLGRKRTFGEN